MADWAELLDHPRTIRAIFGVAPSLDQVELHSILLDRDGPSATLDIELAEAEFPGDPPEKWREAGFNRAVGLKYGGIRELDIRGLETGPIFDLKIERVGELFRVWGGTEQMSVDITADFLAIPSDSVSAFQRRDYPVR